MPRYVVLAGLVTAAAGVGLWVLVQRSGAAPSVDLPTTPTPTPAPAPTPTPTPAPAPTPGPALSETASPRPGWAKRHADRLSIALAHLAHPPSVVVGTPKCTESRCEISVTGKTDQVIRFLAALRKDRAVIAGTKAINYSREPGTAAGSVRSIIAFEYSN